MKRAQKQKEFDEMNAKQNEFIKTNTRTIERLFPMEENKNIFEEAVEQEDVQTVAEDEIEVVEEAAEETTDEEKEPAAEGKDKKKKKKSKTAELELKKSQEKVAELTDRYQRLMAEFENARKRTEKEKSRMYDIGAKEVLEKLLPVVDNFERGLDTLTEEDKESAFAQGIEKIYQQLMTSLDQLGVKPMNAKGTEFNPDLHNAVMHEENEEMGDNLVAEEFQKGYMYKDSVLRFAMVKVVN